MEDDDAIQAYEIAPDGFLVLVKLKQKRPKPIVNKLCYLVLSLITLLLFLSVQPKKKPNPYAYPGYNSMG